MKCTLLNVGFVLSEGVCECLSLRIAPGCNGHSVAQQWGFDGPRSAGVAERSNRWYS